MGELPDLLWNLGTKNDSVFAGFDFPIGVPEHYAKRAQITRFPEALRNFGTGDWEHFYSVCDYPGEVCIKRPFYPNGSKAGSSHRHLLAGHNAEEMASLLRRCEQGGDDQTQASCLFWTLGAKAVGKAAIIGWRDMLVPALKNNSAMLWPFDGKLEALLLPGHTVIAETYPAECYGWFPGHGLRSKTDEDCRKAFGKDLLSWAQRTGVYIESQLETIIEGGFHDDGDDAFDAIVGLFGMLQIVLGQRGSGEPDEEAIRNIEGWILGRGGSNAATVFEAFSASTDPEFCDRLRWAPKSCKEPNFKVTRIHKKGNEDWQDEFVTSLEKSTIANNLASKAIALKNEHLPEKICRYRKDSEHSRGNLKDDTVWLSSPSDYNDPFDCETKISISAVESALARTLVRGFFQKSLRLSDLEVASAKIERGIGESVGAYATRLIEHYKKRLHVRAGDAVNLLATRLSQALPDFATEARQKAGMFRGLTKACSFSERNDSILMWSHYADNHKGFCVEYDLSAVSSTHQFRSTLYPIIYSHDLYDSTPLIVDWIEQARDRWNPFFPLLGFIHKAEDWNYEKEWRLLFVTPTAEPNHAWSAPTPSRIFLGACMMDSAVKEITEIVASKPVEIYKMIRADDCFSLIPRRVH